MRLSCTDFKIWKLVKDNCKIYVFACFFIIVVVNIWIYLFIRLYNICFLRNILRKFFRAASDCDIDHLTLKKKINKEMITMGGGWWVVSWIVLLLLNIKIKNGIWNFTILYRFIKWFVLKVVSDAQNSYICWVWEML